MGCSSNHSKIRQAGIAADQYAGCIIYSSRTATAIYYGNSFDDFASDVNDRITDSFNRFGSVDTVGDAEIKSVADSMKAVTGKGVEIGKSIGSIMDDAIVELTKMTTGGNPKARIFTHIGGAVGNVVSGAVTTGASSVATLANQKSSAGDNVKAVFDIALILNGAKGSDAKEFFNMFSSSSIMQGYVENTASDALKDLVNNIDYAIDDVSSNLSGNSITTPDDTPDNPNVAVGDYNIFVDSRTSKVGESITLSVNEVHGAKYIWHLGDTNNTIIEGGSSISFNYYMAGLHYPMVEIYDGDNNMIGSATTDIMTEYYDFNVNSSVSNAKSLENITFTTTGHDKNISNLDLGMSSIYVEWIRATAIL